MREVGRIQHRRFVVQKVQLFLANFHFFSFPFQCMGWDRVFLSGCIFSYFYHQLVNTPVTRSSYLEE